MEEDIRWLLNGEKFKIDLMSGSSRPNFKTRIRNLQHHARRRSLPESSLHSYKMSQHNRTRDTLDMAQLKATRLVAQVLKKVTKRTTREVNYVVNWIQRNSASRQWVDIHPIVLRALTQKMVYQSHPAESVLFAEHDEANGMFIIINGKVALYQHKSIDEQEVLEVVTEELEERAEQLAAFDEVVSADVKKEEDSHIHLAPDPTLHPNEADFDHKHKERTDFKFLHLTHQVLSLINKLSEQMNYQRHTQLSLSPPLLLELVLFFFL